MKRRWHWRLRRQLFVLSDRGAQTPQLLTSRRPSAIRRTTRPATTTVSGTTGLWFVPTSEVLPARKWSLSLYRTNSDDGQGFTDISTFPATFAVGLGDRAELFGNLVARHPHRPRLAAPFFTGTANGNEPRHRRRHPRGLPARPQAVDRQQARRLLARRQSQSCSRIHDAGWRRGARHGEAARRR